MSSGSAGGSVIGDVVGNIIMVIGIIIIVMLIIGIWLFTKAINAIIRAFVKNPKSKALWIALAVFFLTIGLLIYVSLTQSDQTYAAVAEGAVGLSFAILVITARCVELSASMTFDPCGVRKTPQRTSGRFGKCLLPETPAHSPYYSVWCTCNCVAGTMQPI